MICYLVCFYLFFWFCLKDFFYLSFLFSLSSPTLFMLCIVPLVALLCVSFYFPGLFSTNSNLYTIFISLPLFFSSVCFSCNDPFWYLIFLESTVPPMVLGILGSSKDSDKFDSLTFMIFLNLMFSTLFMFSCSYLTPFFFKLSFYFYFFEFGFSFLVLASFLLLFLSKLPFFLLHFWLTKAHVSAGGSFSMLLASLMLKLGSFGLISFFPFFLIMSAFILPVIVPFCFTLFFLFSLLMIRFLDIKHFVACSSVLHMSFLFPISCYYDSFSISSSMFMMTGHGLVSYILFFYVTLIYEGSHSRSSDMSKCVESYSKTLSMFFVLFCFLNMGVPPLINFFSELLFCSSFVSFSLLSSGFFCLLLLTTVMFVMFLVTNVLFGKKIFFLAESGGFLSSLSFSYFFFLFTLPFLL